MLEFIWKFLQKQSIFQHWSDYKFLHTRGKRVLLTHRVSKPLWLKLEFSQLYIASVIPKGITQETWAVYIIFSWEIKQLPKVFNKKHEPCTFSFLERSNSQKSSTNSVYFSYCLTVLKPSLLGTVYEVPV